MTNSLLSSSCLFSSLGHWSLCQARLIALRRRTNFYWTITSFLFNTTTESISADVITTKRTISAFTVWWDSTMARAHLHVHCVLVSSVTAHTVKTPRRKISDLDLENFIWSHFDHLSFWSHFGHWLQYCTMPRVALSFLFFHMVKKCFRLKKNWINWM